MVPLSGVNNINQRPGFSVPILLTNIYTILKHTTHHIHYAVSRAVPDNVMRFNIMRGAYSVFTTLTMFSAD
jgi:hypothetical protein